MLLLNKPSDGRIRSFFARQAHASFTYAEVGLSDREPPRGYRVDHNRVLLGSGKETYRRAVAALESWKHFDLGWCQLHPSSPPIQVGSNVALLFRHFGFWSLNATRIVYVVNEEGETHRNGFAYGTLADHAETGEERFLVEWNPSSQEVWYDIHAFSRPRHLLARLGYPLARVLQKRFAEDSKRAMVRAVEPTD